jgi:hypothetical protein
MFITRVGNNWDPMSVMTAKLLEPVSIEIGFNIKMNFGQKTLQISYKFHCESSLNNH